MFILSIQNKNKTIRFDRQPDGRITTDNGIEFIKFIIDTFQSNLKDSKDFHDNFLRLINTITPQPNTARNQIINHINDIHDINDLIDILEFVRTTIDHPKTDSQSEWSKHYHNDSESYRTHD